MSDILPFPTTPAERDHRDLMVLTELVILQAQLAGIGAQLAHTNDAQAEKVLDASTQCGRIWEMLR